MNNVTDVLEIVRQVDVSQNNLPEAFLKLIILYMFFSGWQVAVKEQEK